jgi:coatomer protein complex subunit epsilon
MKGDEVDELFDVRTQFYLGNFQSCINEATKTRLKADALKLERDIYIYRSYVAQGNPELVLKEVAETSSNLSLRSVRLWAQYNMNDSREKALEGIKGLLASGELDPYLQWVAVSVYLREGQNDDAWRAAVQTSPLDSFVPVQQRHFVLVRQALLIQILLAMNRPDVADKEAKKMQQQEDDAVLTQLSTAWVAVAVGGDRVQEAASILQELVERHEASPILLNGLAICNLHQKKYDEAERLLLDALEKNPKMPETLANLAVVSVHLRRPPETVTRYQNLLKVATHERHAWLESLRNFDESFERNKARYAAS